MNQPATVAASVAQLSDVSALFETAHPAAIIHWAEATWPAGTAAIPPIVFTASFEDAVLVHLVATHAPSARIVLLDTGYLFAETKHLADDLERRLGIGIDRLVPEPGIDVDVWKTDTEACCAARKVEPLGRALTGASAWITGIRRVDGPTRANAPIVSWDLQRNVVKINPLATWTDEQMGDYATEHDLPANPLTARGYPSIGCWPCTRPVAPGEDRRAGRWSGQDKTECGLHLTGGPR